MFEIPIVCPYHKKHETLNVPKTYFAYSTRTEVYYGHFEGELPCGDQNSITLSVRVGSGDHGQYVERLKHMGNEINRVKYVQEVDPNITHGPSGPSSNVNDYLSIEGWILLETGKHASTGDSGPYSSVYYVVGWIGEGEPEIPPARI